MQELEPALTREQVQKHLGISTQTFWRYVREYPDHFVTYLSGKRRVMDPEDLQAWKAYRKQIDRRQP